MGLLGSARSRPPRCPRFRGSPLGSICYTRVEPERVVELTAMGKLHLSGSITARHPFARAADALEDLACRRNDPVRLALLPEASS